MNEHEIGLEKEQLKTYRFEKLIDLGKLVVLCATVFGCIYGGLHELAKFAGEDSSGAVNLVKSLGLGRLVLILGNGITAVLYIRERKGKKRIIKEKGKLQKQLEQYDEHRSSSDLNEDGSAPDD